MLGGAAWMGGEGSNASYKQFQSNGGEGAKKRTALFLWGVKISVGKTVRPKGIQTIYQLYIP